MHRYASIGQAAEYLKVSERLVRELVAREEFPSYRIRGRRVVRLDEIDALLEKRQANGDWSGR
jgi:excisionase family DNA binding protein